MLDAATPSETRIEADEVREHVARGSGPGGQHRNKTDSCVTLTHIPTGISVRIDTRSQHESRRQAYAILRQRIEAQAQQRSARHRNQQRRQQVGSGMRGDKVRTYRVQDGVVIDHKRGQKLRLDRVIAGYLPQAIF